MINKVKSQKNSDLFIILSLTIFVFIVYASRVPSVIGPSIFPDETSMYAIAAHFAGYDWSDVFSRTGFFYSHGYPLLLVPLFLIFNDIDTIYKISLYLSTLLASTLVPLSYALCRRWGLTSLRENLIFILVIMFSAFRGRVFGFSLIGQPENELIVIAFAATLCFYKVQDKDCKMYWYSVLALLLVFGYSVHQRLLGFLVAGAVVVLIMAICKKISIKNAIVFFCTFFALFFVNEAIKQYLLTNFWAVAEAPTPLNNDFERTVVHAVRVVESPNYLLSALRVAAGQLFYLGVASFLLIYFAIHQLIRKNIKFLVSTREQKSEFDFTLMFMIAAFFLTFAISVVFFHQAGLGRGRGDQLLSGRYNYLMFSVLCLYILNEIVKGNYKLSKSTIVILAIFIGITIWTDHTYRQFLLNREHADGNTFNFTIYRNFAGNFAFYVAAIVSSVLAVLILAIRNLKKYSTKKIVVFTIISSWVLISSVNMYLSNLRANASIVHQNVMKTSITSVISNIDNDNLPIYFFSERARENNSLTQLLQFWLFDRTLNISNNPNQIESSEYYLLLNSPSLIFPESQAFNTTFLEANDRLILFKVDTNDNNQQLYAEGVQIFYMAGENALRIQSPNALEMFYEKSFMWTAPKTSFLLSLDADADYLFRVNLPFQIPPEVGTLNVQFLFDSGEDDIVIYDTTVDSYTTSIEFIVTRDKLTSMHQILHIIGDTWIPVGVFGPDAVDTRSIGFPIVSIETIPMSEIEN